MTESYDLEQAVKAVLEQAVEDADVPAVNIYAGADTQSNADGKPDNKQLPWLLVAATQAESPVVTGPGARVALDVTVATQRDDTTDAAHVAFVRAVRAFLFAPATEALIDDALENFSIFTFVCRNVAHEPQERRWETRATFESLCVSAAVA